MVQEILKDPKPEEVQISFQSLTRRQDGQRRSADREREQEGSTRHVDWSIPAHMFESRRAGAAQGHTICAKNNYRSSGCGGNVFSKSKIL